MGERLTRRTHGGPICQVAGASALCNMLTAERALPCGSRVRIVHASMHGSPAQPALSFLVYISQAVRSARRIHRKWQTKYHAFLVHSIEIWLNVTLEGELIRPCSWFYRRDGQRSGGSFLPGKVVLQAGPSPR